MNLGGQKISGNNLVEYLSEGDVKIIIPSHGPAIGAGYSLAGDTFFAAMNISVTYMWSKFDYEKNTWRFFEPSGTDNFTEKEPAEGSGYSFDTRQIGINIEPSVGLKAENVIVTFGFRLQWMRTQFIHDS